MEEEYLEHKSRKNGYYGGNHEPQISEPSEPKIEPRIDNEPDKRNPWVAVSLILGVVVIILLVLMFRGGITGGVIGVEKTISKDVAGTKVIEYLNTRTGGGIEFISLEDLGDLYEVTVEYQGQDIPVYITKDGKYFVQGAVEINATPTQPTTQEPQEIPKSDKPVVELFVMTHCPYGTQAEKGIIPVYELLGDKIDGNIKFVHYFMHAPEETETPMQVCIREEQSDKYLSYLKCFLEDGESDRCLIETKIDKTGLTKCVDTKAEDYYNVDSELSENYGVKGSPTLVINGQIVNSGRSPVAYLETVCSAFNEAPEECSEELSTASPNPGFGYDTTSGGNDAAQCG